GKFVFSQLLDFLDKDIFLRISNKYNGNRYVKFFTCWNQLAVLMFGQLSNRESLRDLALATQALSRKAFHLGFGKYATKSNLSKANNGRDYHIFEEFAYRVIAEARECRATDIFKLNGHVYAFDSTTIELCLNAFKWAVYRKNQRKGGIKVHTLYDIETSIPTFFHITEARVNDMRAMDAIPYEENSFYIFDRGYNDFKRLYAIESIGAYFVVRGKKNNDFRPMKWKRRFPPGSGILSDAIGYMDGQLTMGKYPDKIRRVIYWNEESKRKFIFFTNAFSEDDRLDISPVMVAELYHNRWQIELFFKWLKQHLKIKKFWGTSENAVRIQIYSAITAYCMMAIVQKKMRTQRPIYEMLQLVSVSLTETLPLGELFDKPNNNRPVQ
ncbi:IS4 family transposase, partial [uncultured Duncaniella sp.]|uniref:IS4 family transposase n=1 Tax=uncultured Duncaniella sp. TaxID=2768039 RepID=UPI0025A598DB